MGARVGVLEQPAKLSGHHAGEGSNPSPSANFGYENLDQDY